MPRGRRPDPGDGADHDLGGRAAFLGAPRIAARRGSLGRVQPHAGLVGIGRVPPRLPYNTRRAGPSGFWWWPRTSRTRAPDLIGAITAMAGSIAPRPYPGNAATAHAFQASAYMARNGLHERDMARVIVKNCANGVDNEYAQLRQAVTADEVLAVAGSGLADQIELDASPRTQRGAAVSGRATGRSWRTRARGGDWFRQFRQWRQFRRAHDPGRR